MKINVNSVIEGRLKDKMDEKDYETWSHLQPHARQLVLEIAVIERLDKIVELLGRGGK